MATFNKFYDFVEQLGKGTHQLHAAGHTLKVALTNTVPVITNTVLADITEISATAGYTAGGEDSQNTFSESSGTATVVCTDITWTAVGGNIGPLRYAVWYNEASAGGLSKPLIGWWDYASSVTIAAGETFKADFGAGTLTIAWA